ncbi:MAG: hypothetical protein R3336_03275 [Phycisphaeraceae bacterium]|nr:hypothetical protein [Phycisphaeraceae bacterium]
MSKVDQARNWVNKNASIATLATIVALVAALTYIVWFAVGGGPKDVPQNPVYFYDLKHADGNLDSVDLDHLYVEALDTFPPALSPTGDGKLSKGMPAGVKAHVFGCGNCEPGTARFIGWLEIYKPDVHDLLENQSGPDFDPALHGAAIERGRMVALPADVGVPGVPEEVKGRWVEAQSSPGKAIRASIHERCSQVQQPVECFPDKDNPE